MNLAQIRIDTDPGCDSSIHSNEPLAPRDEEDGGLIIRWHLVITITITIIYSVHIKPLAHYTNTTEINTKYIYLRQTFREPIAHEPKYYKYYEKFCIFRIPNTRILIVYKLYEAHHYLLEL